MRERLGEELVVAAMGAVDGVRGPQRDDGADRAALLADARVRRAVHETLAGQLQDRLLKGPDEVRCPSMVASSQGSAAFQSAAVVLSSIHSAAG